MEKFAKLEEMIDIFLKKASEEEEGEAEEEGFEDEGDD
jgi:hypothetical protein